jgi:hypothetical protein
MATVYHTRRGEVVRRGSRPTYTVTADAVGEEFTVCSLCGGKAAGFWFANTVVATCVPCGLHALPRLLADAVVGEHADGPDTLTRILGGLETLITSYLRAAKLAVERSAQLTKEEKARRRRKTAAPTTPAPTAAAVTASPQGGTAPPTFWVPPPDLDP